MKFNHGQYTGIAAIICIFGLAALLSCETHKKDLEPAYSGTSPAGEFNHYHFAVHPWFNPDQLFLSYLPLVDYINSHIHGARFELESSRDYGEFESKIRAHDPDLILPNPWQTLLAMKEGYTVIATAGNDDDFKGLFIARKDAHISGIKAMSGKTFAYPSPTALAACIMPQWLLHENGINVNNDIRNNYVGSQESAILNAYMKQADIAVTWPPPWRVFQKVHPVEASQLEVIMETKPLKNNSVMIRKSIPDSTQKQIQDCLIHLNESANGIAILEGMQTARFHQASDIDYDTVRKFIAQFEEHVRTVEKK